jgi:glyoxylase-like metal-dependent hydrolase (beta-lactamase superfamily II)
MPRKPHFRAVTVIAFAVAVVAACSKNADAPKETAEAPPVAAEPAVVPAPAPVIAPVAEPNPVPKPQNVFAFKIGELDAMALRDGGLEVPNDNKVFGVGLTRAEVGAVLAAAGLPTSKLSLTIQPLLVKAKDRVLLFDTGAGTLFGPGAGHLARSLKEAGVDAASVTDIFISHSHGDHAGGLVNAEGGLSFPNATIHLSAPEWKHMSANDRYAAINKVIGPKVVGFAPDAELVPGTVKAIEIEGHTPGHSGYLITSGAGSLLYVGDSMHHYVISVQRPEWTIAYDEDAPIAQKSRTELIAQSAANAQRIYAVHFPFPGIGKFENREDGIVWVAE